MNGVLKTELAIYDSLTKTLIKFIPHKPPLVSMYVCGATVQAPPHIGHIRSMVVFDVIRRWLTVLGYEVVLVRNVTDIDDKILAKAKSQKIPWWQLAAQNEFLFQQAYQQLNILPPTIEPRATGFIPQMITYINRLINAGFAYVVDGNVYFAVSKLANYGQLSRQRVEKLLSEENAGLESYKRSPLDFALWKKQKPDEPAWETPWGSGRPGWHLECSVMSTYFLGNKFDIHGGGRDLIFPHHENELAQSTGAGDEFALYWVHNGMVTIAGDKMSKSLGNTLSLDELLSNTNALAIRYYFLSAHYRTNLDFSITALLEAAAACRRIENFILQAKTRLNLNESELTQIIIKYVPEQFIINMNNDFSTPASLAIIHEQIKQGNTALQNNSLSELKTCTLAVASMLSILGINPFDKVWKVNRVGKTQDSDPVAKELINLLTKVRNLLRREKLFVIADNIRDELKKIGITLTDNKDK